ncbi:hypothetical protein ACUHMQ_00290 [Chitinimonas sp. PSY-7]|uniref:hypothetical protein n=1 Tax=Chitinimonas sp. PSY-7 TaxID=3459088 RepID=UPI004040241C
MIVPKYWAESSIQHLHDKKHITVKRFGWSDTGLAEAQAHAELRAKEALQRLIAGEKLPRRELKKPYNGADGVPIREEIIARHGDTVITRNLYGAHCLNTPDVLFIDIDFISDPSVHLQRPIAVLGTIIAIAIGWITHSLLIGIALFAAVLIFYRPICAYLVRFIRYLHQDNEAGVRARVAQFLKTHPSWHFRLYLTPAGMRVLVTHQTFKPSDPTVKACFDALKADPVYVRMCLNQHCFRARVSPKPWRIGIKDHIRPQPGVWPVDPKHMPRRLAWIAEYEASAKNFAACRFLAEIGSGVTHFDVAPVQKLHDELCQALNTLPIA